MYTAVFVHAILRRVRPIFRTGCFHEHHRDGPRHSWPLNERANERTNTRASGAKKIEQRENRRRAYFGGFFFGDTCNYSSRTRADINGELLDGHTDIPARRSFRGPFNFHDSWRPCWDGRITRVDTGYCTYAQDVAGALALADTTHAGARMNFDKTARISTEDRDSTSVRRRVWRGQFNEIQPGLRIPHVGEAFFSFFFFYTRRVTETVDEWNRYIPRATVIDYWLVTPRSARGCGMTFIIPANWRLKSENRIRRILRSKFRCDKWAHVLVHYSRKPVRRVCLFGIKEGLEICMIKLKANCEFISGKGISRHSSPLWLLITIFEM